MTIAEDLGVTVISEGIENQAQAEYLVRAGSHLFQGYHFGRPAPAPHPPLRFNAGAIPAGADESLLAPTPHDTHDGLQKRGDGDFPPTGR